MNILFIYSPLNSLPWTDPQVKSQPDDTTLRSHLLECLTPNPSNYTPVWTPSLKAPTGSLRIFLESLTQPCT